MAQKAIHVNLAPTDPKNIAAGDDAAILSGVIGSALASSSGILAFGERLNLTKVTDNSVKVASGIYLNQGHAVRVTSDEVLTVLSGTQGKQRIDLIVSEYRKGSERDTHVIKTIQGSLFDADPEAPSLQAENLHGAGTVRQEEIGRIVFNGTSIASVVKTAKTISGLVELTDSIADHNHDTKYLGKTAKATDSDKLGGYVEAKGALPNTITTRDHSGRINATSFLENGVDLSDLYLSKTGTAANSNKLGGYESKRFLNSILDPDSTGEYSPDYFQPGVRLTRHSQCPNPTNYFYIITFQYQLNTHRMQIAVEYVQGKILATRTQYDGNWTDWSIHAPTLHGTSTPPSSLLTGQIYVQY